MKFVLSICVCASVQLEEELNFNVYYASGGLILKACGETEREANENVMALTTTARRECETEEEEDERDLRKPPPF